MVDSEGHIVYYEGRQHGPYSCSRLFKGKEFLSTAASLPISYIRSACTVLQSTMCLIKLLFLEMQPNILFYTSSWYFYKAFWLLCLPTDEAELSASILTVTTLWRLRHARRRHKA